ncbi:hypothetical protein ABL78_3681 [Leptomonas seymouri]|uniref:Uncharacterized protein n=1 Tax=Leptomonas seymouri TaxID=5684 RepID=A0A0N1I5T7_LEPSE|nr:hypothetical protein ABL78_3681 [Leptomonas seymouri]|eukprot:KPI87244.1 hypothetical protein ABL78_3681 [Leptomonas seymouri]
MGALPSHETHDRGLYSHRHGRNRRNEIILIPLTTAFFPSPDCPLFQHLYNSRYRRTAKYYYRALRSTQTPRESDYFCTTTAVNEEEEFEKFYQAYLSKRELAGGTPASAAADARGGGGAPLHPPQLQCAPPSGANVGSSTVPLPQSPQDCLNAQGKPSKVGPMDFRSFADSREGLYQVLVRDNEPGVFDTDEELRQAYWRQIQEQQTERQRVYQSQQRRRAATAAAETGVDANGVMPPPPPPPPPVMPPSPRIASSSGSGNGGGAPHGAPIGSDAFATRALPQPRQPLPRPPAAPPASMLMSMDELSFDDFVSGYVAARRYMKGKPAHTHLSTAAAVNARGDVIPPADGATGRSAAEGEYAARHYKHVTSPCAYDVRPLPCVIASRYDPGKPQPVEDPLYVPFGSSYVKIMGMFGFFPATVGVRRATAKGAEGAETGHAESGGSGASGTGPAPPRRCFPRKEGNSNGDDDVDEETEVEQHLLKGTMFVDKDVGDQILGNMVMLATYMYVRQCIEARINPQAIPMLPVMLRFPLSNIPMLQFVREFRVRLRSLLEAGTAKAGQKPVHIGMSGFNPEDLTEPHHPQVQRLEEEGYLFEPDIPTATSYNQLFMSAEQAKSTSAPLRRHAGVSTNECGKYPVVMMSGFNVQSTPLSHPALNTTGYPPAMAAAAMVAAASSYRCSPQSRSMPASPYTNEMPGSVSGGAGVGRVPTFPPTAPPPPLPGQGGAANTAITNNGAAPPPLPPPPPPPPAPGTMDTRPTTPAEEARKVALLHRRKQRFRIWVEDGHMCIWASAAYARRAALIMSQQLNTTVDSNSVPEQRSWNYRGLLHAEMTVPPPRHVNDVIIVAEDIPRMGLWQGDVLRCCTEAELRAMNESKGNAPLPLPCSTEAPRDASRTSAADPLHSLQSSLLSLPSASKSTVEAIGSMASPASSTNAAESSTRATSSTDLAAASSNTTTVHVNFTSNHISNPLLQEKEVAPPGAFWVRGAGGLDDSFTNITETNMPPHPKAEKQLQQAAMQRAKKAAAAVAAAQNSGKRRRGLPSEAAAVAAAQLFADIDRREGTLNIEEVVLSWIKVMAILTRDSTEEDRAWVRDPQNNPVRIDRYVIRRYEHDGVRFFIGVTPRFVGQQRRIEKVLGEVYALEEREGRRRRELQQGSDDGIDDDDNDMADDDGGFSGTHRIASLSLMPHSNDPLSYPLGRRTSAAGGVGGAGNLFNDVWGVPGVPPLIAPAAGSANAAATPPRDVARGASSSPNAVVGLPQRDADTPASEMVESTENISRLAFAAVFGGSSADTLSAKTDQRRDLACGGFEVDDLLERYKADSLFFGDNDDE